MFIHHLKRSIEIVILIILALAVFWLYKVDFGQGKNPVFGVTFSQKYAASLNADWQKILISILDELKVKHFRLIAYWDFIEPVKDNYDFSDLDWQIKEAKSRNAEIVLAVGRKLPRWPECHDPEWAKKLIDTDENKFNAEILDYIKTVVEHYRNENTIKIWQIENEPFLPFGDCKKY